MIIIAHLGNVSTEVIEERLLHYFPDISIEMIRDSTEHIVKMYTTFQEKVYDYKLQCYTLQLVIFENMARNQVYIQFN